MVTMRHATGLMISASLLLVAFSCDAMAAPAVAEKTLPNGLKVLVMEKSSTPVVAVQVWYRVGSRDDGEGQRGRAHLFEHLMFRGSDHYASEEHSRSVSGVGGTCNAFTFFDMTVYHQLVPSDSLEMALQLESDRMGNLQLDADALEKERNVVREEILGYQDDPFFDMLSRTLRSLYPGHPYSFTPLGTLDDVAGVTLADCESFYERYYGPNNAVVVIVGDVKAEEAIALCERHFGELAPRALPEAPALDLDDGHSKKPVRLRGDIPVPATGVVFRLPEGNHPDRVALKALVHLLSQGETARLHRALVNDSGLAVMGLGYPQFMQGPGVFVYVAGHFPTVSSKKVERAIRGEMNRLREEEISPEELNRVKRQLLRQCVMDRYSAAKLAHALGTAEVIEGDYRNHLCNCEKIEGLTPAGLQRVARAHFRDDKMQVLRFRPKRFSPLVWLYGLVQSGV